MTLGRVQDAGSETLPDAPGVSLSPPRNPPLLLRLLCSAGDPWGESLDFWLGVERSIGRRRDEGWTDKWERQGLVVWKACRLNQWCQLSKVKMMPHLVWDRGELQQGGERSPSCCRVQPPLFYNTSPPPPPCQPVPSVSPSSVATSLKCCPIPKGYFYQCLNLRLGGGGGAFLPWWLVIC